MDMKILKTYYDLTKPGIIYANALTAIAGYLFGSKWNIETGSFLGVIIGTSLVIAGACVYNNVLDRGIDRRMKRTKQRALITGVVSAQAALLFATTLATVGFLLLALLTNLTVVVIGIVGLIDYVILYGWTKRHSTISTIVGSVSGSTSIIAGYCAATGRFDTPAALLFLVLTLWQMPHFYAIAMFRKSDYIAAGLPLMPLKQPERTVKLRMLAYIAAYIIAAVLLTTAGNAAVVSMLIMVTLGCVWLYKGIASFSLESAKWGKMMFLFSLTVNIGISFAVAIGSIAP